MLFVVPEWYAANLDLFRAIQNLYVPESFALQAADATLEIKDLAVNDMRSKITIRSVRISVLADPLRSIYHNRDCKAVVLASVFDQALAIFSANVSRVHNGEFSASEPLADHGISRATAYRYVAEAVDVLSAQAPGLDEALARALEEGVPYVILDGKIFETDRLGETVTSVKGGETDAWYSGKKHRPGANVQAVVLPSGLPIWTSEAEPGHVHDITAARARALPLLYRAAAAGMPTLADGGYEGAGIGIHVPVKNPGGNQQLDPDNRTRNSLLRGLRSQGERGFALISQRWTTLQRITASPRRTTEIVRAALVLTQFEHKYLS